MKRKLLNKFHFTIANKYLQLYKERKPKVLITQQNFTVSNAVALFQDQQFQWPCATTCSSRNEGFTKILMML
jgi:hypothetical protein